MQIVEGWTDPERAFGFTPDTGELLMSADAVTADLPNVTAFHGASLIGTGMDNSAYKVHEHGGITWMTLFTAGEKLVSVEAGSKAYVSDRSPTDPNTHVRTIGGDLVGSYVPANGDLLIADIKHMRNRDDDQDGVNLLEATQPLPSSKSTRYSVLYDLHGAIEASGGLVTWGHKGETASWLIGLAVGHALTTTDAERQAVAKELRREPPLPELIAGNALARLYLTFWRESRSVDFMPTTDPRKTRLPVAS